MPCSASLSCTRKNGRGKTTLSALFRSLVQNRPDLIQERRRLAATHPPEVIIDCAGGPPPAMFQNDTWNRHLPNLAVFDDAFVDENVCSGLSVEADHRQNLHELIIGAQGVALNQQLQAFVRRIEAHNAELRSRASAVPAASMGGMTIDAFCALQPEPNIDANIQEAERALQAAREQTPIREAQPFEAITLPAFDNAVIEQVLARDLPGLDTAAVARVQEHLSRMPAGSEAWVADGMRRIPPGARQCPFCAQDMTASPVLTHYPPRFPLLIFVSLSLLQQLITEYVLSGQSQIANNVTTVNSAQMILVACFQQDMDTLGAHSNVAGTDKTEGRLVTAFLNRLKQFSGELKKMPAETKRVLCGDHEQRNDKFRCSTFGAGAVRPEWIRRRGQTVRTCDAEPNQRPGLVRRQGKHLPPLGNSNSTVSHCTLTSTTSHSAFHECPRRAK